MSLPSSVSSADLAATLPSSSASSTAQLPPFVPSSSSQPQPLSSSSSLHPPPPLASAASTSSLSSSASQHPQLVALRKIDALSESLQKEGKLLESLQCMEKSLILRGHIFGLDSVEVYRACKSVGEMCNYLAMTFLQQDLFDLCLELLKKAEVLTEKHPAVRAITYNNLACYYRKRGKLRTALNYCRKALGIEGRLAEGGVKSADTHLNMCTILSELRRHEKAIVHARIALKMLLMELFGDFTQLQQQQQQAEESMQRTQQAEDMATGQAAASSSSSASSAVLSSLRSQLPPDRVAVLAIAYHNLAVQQEFLGKYNDALVSYEKASKVVMTHLGSKHPLVASLSDSYQAALKKLEAKNARLKEHALNKGSGVSKKFAAQKEPSRLQLHASKSAKALNAQIQRMPDPAETAGSDGEYDAKTIQAGFNSDGGF